MQAEPSRDGGALLAAVAREVETLASEAHRLQDVLAGIGSNGALSEQALEGVQGLDALAQHAVELAGVLAALAAGAPAEWRVQLESTLLQLPLAALAGRLSASGGAPFDADSAASGELELL